MFRAIFLPIFRSTRLCVTVCAPEDGQNNCPKHVELTGIINKPLSLLLVGCLYYCYGMYKFTILCICDGEAYRLIMLLGNLVTVKHLQNHYVSKVGPTSVFRRVGLQRKPVCRVPRHNDFHMVECIPKCRGLNKL